MRLGSLTIMAMIIAVVLYPPNAGNGQVKETARPPVIDSISRIADSLEKRIDIVSVKLDLINTKVENNHTEAVEIRQLPKQIKSALAKKQKIKVVEKKVPIYITLPAIDFAESNKKKDDTLHIYRGTQPRGLSDFEKKSSEGIWRKIFKKRQ